MYLPFSWSLKRWCASIKMFCLRLELAYSALVVKHMSYRPVPEWLLRIARQCMGRRVGWVSALHAGWSLCYLWRRVKSVVCGLVFASWLIAFDRNVIVVRWPIYRRRRADPSYFAPLSVDNFVNSCLRPRGLCRTLQIRCLPCGAT